MSQLFKIFKSEKRKIPPELPKRDYFKYSSITTKDSKLSKIGYDVILVSDYCDPIDCKVKHLESIDQLSPIKASSKSLIDLDSVVPNLDEVKEYEDDPLLYSYSLPLTECDQLSIDTDSLMIETSLRETPSPQSVNCSQHLSRIFKENFQPIRSILSDRIKLDNRYCSKYDKGMAVLNRWSRNGSNIDNKLAHSNCLFKDNLYRSHRRQGSESSFSFTTDQSSISSTTSSSSPSSSHDSSSILKHLDSSPANGMLPKRQGIKTNLNIPRSRSSDITLNLLASSAAEAERSGELVRRPKTKLGSTYYLLKSNNCDAISSLDSDSDSSTKCLLKSSQESATSAETKVATSNKSLNNSSSSKETLTFTKGTITVNSSDLINSSTSKSEKLESNQSVKLINLDKDSNLKSDTVTSSACDNKPRLQSPSNDTRPLDDYDSPWDTEQRLNKVVEDIITSPTSTGSMATSTTSPPLHLPPPPPPPSPPPTTTTAASTTLAKLTTSAKSASSSTHSLTISTSLKSSPATKRTESNEDNLKSISSQVSIQSQSKSANFSEIKPSLQPQPHPSSPLASPQPTSKPNKLSLNLNTKVGDNLSTSSASNLNLDIGLRTEKSKKMVPRKKPTLSFSQQLLPVVCEDVDSSLPLEKQGWYHGSITRFDAENLLRPMKEGSYLIRNCESTKQDFSLSLKSAKGFMHMKIVKNGENKYVLGVFSKPFSTIPEMVKHYTINKLPIRGAEHMSLLYPVIDQLL